MAARATDQGCDPSPEPSSLGARQIVQGMPLDVTMFSTCQRVRCTYPRESGDAPLIDKYTSRGRGSRAEAASIPTWARERSTGGVAPPWLSADSAPAVRVPCRKKTWVGAAVVMAFPNSVAVQGQTTTSAPHSRKRASHVFRSGESGRMWAVTWAPGRTSRSSSRTVARPTCPVAPSTKLLGGVSVRKGTTTWEGSGRLRFAEVSGSDASVPPPRPCRSTGQSRCCRPWQTPG